MCRVPPSLAASALLSLAALSPASAQPSTERLPNAERSSRKLRVEVSGGASLIPIRDIVGLTPSGGTEPYAALVALRWAAETRGGVRAMGWWLHNGARMRVYDGAGGFRDEKVTQNILALAAAIDGTWRVGRRATLALAVGPGLASARGAHAAYQPNGGQTKESASAVGRLLTAGLALRYGSLVVEQHGLILLGAERAVPEGREFFPLTVGWRF